MTVSLTDVVERLDGGVVELAVADAVDVEAVTIDSRTVQPGMLFAALRGEHHDGHDFVADAVAAGATAVLVDRVPVFARLVESATATILVDDVRLRLGPVASLLSGDPSRDLLTVGITGTNGKTTTTEMLSSIVEAAGLSPGRVGTLHGARTTPEAPDLQGRLAEFVAADRRAAVIEVSSHALALHRVDGTAFDAVAFTNLGRDHLDLHGSVEDYFRAKARLFTAVFAPLAVVNVADPHGRLLADAITDMRVVPVDHRMLDGVWVDADRHGYRWDGVDVVVGIGGDFNVANSLLAATIAREVGIGTTAIRDGLATVAAVPGRFEIVRPSTPAASPLVLVDYAHTPEGLAEVLTAARPHVGVGGALTVVFGCGGERDRDKRPEMGAVAADLADVVVVTSDNPRHESPSAIIADVLSGIAPHRRSSVRTEVDRRSAIVGAVGSASTNDVVVIAGKGHESTQQIGDDLVPFDDRSIAREAFEDRVVRS